MHSELFCPSESYNRRAFSSHVTTDEHRGVKGHGVHCAATRKTFGGAAPEPHKNVLLPQMQDSRSFDEVAVRSEQAIVPFLHLRSIYALDPQSMEETSE